MRHARTGKKLGRDPSHRKALYANLACSLIEHGRIKTTQAKAKAVKPYVEKMITLGRRGDLHARRQALADLRSQDVVHKLFAEIAGRMADRPGGYTRIIKIGHRPGDAAEMVYLELVLLAYFRWKFFEDTFIRALGIVTFAGVIIAAISAGLGSLLGSGAN